MSRTDESSDRNNAFDNGHPPAQEGPRTSRRQFALTGLCAGTMLLAPDARCGSVTAKPIESPAPASSGSTTFASIKQIEAGLLNVGYAEAGPADGQPSFCCTAGPMTFTATRSRAHFGRSRLSRARSLPPGFRRNAFPLR